MSNKKSSVWRALKLLGQSLNALRESACVFFKLTSMVVRRSNLSKN